MSKPPFLITMLTDSNLNNSLNYALFSLNFNLYINLIILVFQFYLPLLYAPFLS